MQKPRKKRVEQTDDELLDAASAENSRALRGGTAPELVIRLLDPLLMRLLHELGLALGGL